MNEKEQRILNNFINKKKQVLEFEEIQAIVKLLLVINNKIENLVS